MGWLVAACADTGGMLLLFQQRKPSQQWMLHNVLYLIHKSDAFNFIYSTTQENVRKLNDYEALLLFSDTK